MICLTILKDLKDHVGLIEEPLSSVHPELSVHHKENVADAVRDIYAGEADAIILEPHLWPAEGRSPVLFSGTELVKKLRKDGKTLPVLFLLNADSYGLASEIQEYDNCDVVFVKIGKPWPKKITDKLKYLLKISDSVAGAPKPKLRVDIIAKLTREWEFRFVPKGWSIPEQDSRGFLFGLDDDGRRRLASQTASTELLAQSNNPADWRASLETVGIVLMDQIFQHNLPFSQLFERFQKEVGRENTSIRFVLGSPSDHLNSIALEALFERGPNRFLMLDVPVYRSLATQYSSVHQNQVTDPLNFLILECDASGTVDGRDLGGGQDLHLDNLGFVAEECATIEKYLWDLAREQSDTRAIGVIERVRSVTASANGKQEHSVEVRNDGENWHSVDKSYHEYVEMRLGRQAWHTIHYSGHSHYQPSNDGNGGFGYLFFPGRTVMPVEAEGFAHKIRNKTRFIYCNSCNSAHEKIVCTFAQHNVPTVMGFRWKIDDEWACEYAKSYYSRLLRQYPKPDCFEQALLGTQREMEKSAKNNLVWAAGVLMQQQIGQ